MSEPEGKADLPSVKLPPAALRLPMLELDPVGNPYYKFPPFLPPPDGVTLIPFDKFRAHGIEICLDSDIEEVDGEGIPTVELSTKHAPPEDKVRKKKKRVKKDGDESKIVSTWWDDWAEGEDLRRAYNYDPNTPRTDRFAQGASDFQQGRRFTPQLQTLYDRFRHYCGLLGHATKESRFGRKRGDQEADDDDEEDGDDNGDDEAELSAMQEKLAEDHTLSSAPVVGAANGTEANIHEVDAEYDAEEQEKGIRMDMFLNDPVKSMGIFFSSYYKDKGLFWSETKLRDGPILLSFFLAFFVRNKLMPDYEKAFRKALKVVEQARLELPQTTKISMAMPDTFGSACAALWGSKMPKAWEGKNAMDLDAWPTSAPEPVDDWKAELKEKGMVEIDVDLNPNVPGEPTGWGDAIERVEDTGGVAWGDSATVIRDEEDPWSAPVGDWSSNGAQSSLLSILGPTTLPLTHATQLVEKSTRQILSFSPPNPDDKGLGRVLGSVMLAPWKNTKEDSVILPPELLTDLPEGSTFDLARDVIRAFVDPKTVEVLRGGMGLHAVFVQVVEDKEEVKEKRKKSRSKGRSKKDSDDREWWYIEFLYEVLPSFWTEED